MTRLAILGAGHTGPVIGRVARDAGYDVSISASGDPAKISLIVQVLVPGAQALWTADAVAAADLVVLAVPLHRFFSLEPGSLAGKLVVDTMNYWPPTDGVLPAFEGGRGSSEIVAQHLDRSTVVKTLNHIGYHELDADRRPAGDPARRALGVAGDDQAAVTQVASLIDDIGYDPVRVDSLLGGRLFQPGGPVFGAPLTAKEFEALI